MSAAGDVASWIDARIAAGDFPGAVWMVSGDDGVLAEGSAGLAVVEPERIAAGGGTLYDLASLTKPLATALVVLGLHEAGVVGLDDPVVRHLPGWRAGVDRAGVTVLDLLVHRSGLPAWAPLYLHASDRRGRIAWLSRTSLAHPPRTRALYSDLGYILLGFLIEEAAGAPLDRLFADRVAGPTGADVLFCPPAERRRAIAATERGNARERALAGREGDRYNGWPATVAWGEAHDLNARTLGGVAGHAGLFGTVRGVHLIARALLDDRGAPIGPEARALLFRNFTAGLGEDRSVGFQIASSPGSSAGPALSPGSVGHTGFTGTSLWIDPMTRRIAILLTNRVHPLFRDLDMNRLRREFHALAAAL